MSDIEREKFETVFLSKTDDYGYVERDGDWYISKPNAHLDLSILDAKYSVCRANSAWKAWQAAKQDVGECEWSEDENGIYDTSCGGVFELMSGTPEENNFKCCCYCGGVLKQKLFEQPREQS